MHRNSGYKQFVFRQAGAVARAFVLSPLYYFSIFSDGGARVTKAPGGNE